MALKKEYLYEMDCIMAPVMPESWDGHGRIEKYESEEESGFDWN